MPPMRWRYIPTEETFPFKYGWPHGFVLVNLQSGGEPMILRAKAWCQTTLTDEGTRWKYVTQGRYLFLFRDYEDAFMFRMLHG